MEKNRFPPIVESLIFSSPEPISEERIAAIVKNITPEEIRSIVKDLNERYSRDGSSFHVREIAGGYQFSTRREYARWVKELFSSRRILRLSQSALETLAIIAYRQPVVKAEIESVRGVSAEGVLHNLLKKSLIEVAGRKETLGRPILYRPSQQFLKYFGLRDIDELPPLEEFEEFFARKIPEAAGSRDPSE